MEPPDDDDLDQEAATSTAQLLRSVRWILGRPCAGECGHALCGHDALLSITLGYRPAPRCCGCLAAELQETRAELVRRSVAWISRRDCFYRGWLWASAHEGWPGVDLPPCQMGGDAEPEDARTGASATPLPQSVADGAAATGRGLEPDPDSDWDAGSLSCGELLLQLRKRLLAAPPGTLLRVRSDDPAAPIDLPAWCGLTGHTLLDMKPPEYWILRRDEPDART